jgi:ElaB/YqjD/DUF883 family membrane-anchored ribosome-binding protein
MATESGKTKADGAAEQRSPEEIQADIEQTREELGDTVGELAEKADVKKQAKRKVSQTKAKAAAKKDEVVEKATAQTGTVKEKATAQKDAATAKVREATPASAEEGAQQASQAARQVAAQASHTAQENPIPSAAIGAFIAGLLIGWIIGRR